MSAPAVLDFLTGAAVVAGFGGALRVGTRHVGTASKALLFVTLTLYLFVAISNVLEHTGVTSLLDPYEDYAEMLFFPFAMFFVYASWTNIEHNRRTAAETRLRERERTLSTLMGNLPGMAYRCRNDRQWTMEFVSEGCHALTGRDPADIIGNKACSYNDLIAPEDRDRIWREVQTALAEKRPFRIEYRIRDTQGRERWVWEQGIGIFRAGGELEALEGFISDVTEHKAAEHELEVYRRHLESLVQMRTRQLQEAQSRLEKSIETLREDEEAGKITQFRLLPSETAEIGDYVFNRALLPSMFLSGDFMDCFAVDAHRVAFFMADVSGHGASSAFVTVLLKSITRNCLENYKSEDDRSVLDPAMMLSRINAEIYHDNLGKHITIFYGVLDSGRNSLVYSAAGQFPFPILFENGSPEILGGSAVPVGLFESSAYENIERALPDDFVLFLSSDGILEVLPQEDTARKVGFLAARAAEDSFDIPKMLSNLGLDRLETFPDDIAFLTVRKQNHAGGQDTPRT